MIRVLLVGDERHVAERIVAHLRAHGMEALVHEGAEAALDATPRDAALVDLRLPGMSGLDLARRLTERDKGDLDLKRRTRTLERQLFAEALRRAGGRKSDASRLLGIDASNWAYHAKRLGL